MNEIIHWIEENLGPDVTLVTPQFERTEELDFHYVPDNEDDFSAVLGNAPWDILKGMGFRKWSKMNDLIKENLEMESSKTISIPVINSDKPMNVLVGRQESYPTKLLEVDADMIMFPGEWFGAIPEGFIVTGLYGEQYSFHKAIADDDIRFGCLAYGFQKLVETT